MRPRFLLALALIASACAQPTSESASTSSTAPTTSTAADTATPTEATSTPPVSGDTSTTRPPANPDRDPAPDFGLTLSDGTEYQLANEVRPVYLVFWAEW